MNTQSPVRPSYGRTNPQIPAHTNPSLYHGRGGLKLDLGGTRCVSGSLSSEVSEICRSLVAGGLKLNLGGAR